MMEYNESMMIHRTIKEWCSELGAVIMDNDGFHFTEDEFKNKKISAAGFIAGFNQCTCKMPKDFQERYAKFIHTYNVI